MNTSRSGAALLLCLWLVPSAAQSPEVTGLAERLEAAENPQARLAILNTQNKDLLTAELIRVCLERGQTSSRASDQQLALRSYESALAVATHLGDAAHIAQAYRGIGLARFRQGRFAEALEAYRSGLEAATQAGEPKLVAESLRSMGMAHRALGNFSEALVVDQRSLELYRKAGDTMGTIAVLSGMGNSHARLGELRKAVQNFERCVQLGEAAGNKLAVYRAIESIGNTYLTQGDAVLSLSYLEKSLALRQEAAAPKAELVNVYINLIQAYRATDRANDALRAAGMALELAPATDRLGRAYALLNRAGVYRALHRYPEALDDLGASLAIHEEHKAPLEIAGALSQLAQVELDVGREAGALEHALRAADLSRKMPAPDLLWQALESVGAAYRRLNRPRMARAAFAEGISAVDGLRTQLAGGEQQGLEFLRDKMTLFHGLMSLHIEAGDVEDALQVAERAKAGLILDVLRAGHAGGGEARLRRGAVTPLTVADSARLLPDARTALLEFAVAPDATYVFAITRDRAGVGPRLRVQKLAWKEDALAREVEAFRRQLASRDPGYRATAAALYAKLLGPVGEALRGRTLLSIVPDGPLWSLPFQALIEPGGRHLIENSAVFYAPSLTALLESVRGRRALSTGSRTVLAMGDSSGAREVAALGRMYGGRSLALTGADATEARWKALAPQYRVLHLAAHGVLNASNPLYSYVAMRAGGGEDGFIEAREILGLHLNADLAVLSACESGRGGFHHGEGVVGLSWALMVAGAPATVVSQWKVDSESTTGLMLAFHEGLRVSGKAAALRNASLELLKDARFRHPYYWAGFVLVGDGY